MEGEPGWPLLTTDPALVSHAALLGWIYRTPGSVSEHGETELLPSCTAPGMCLQKKDLQEQCDSRKLGAGCSSGDFLRSNSNSAPAFPSLGHYQDFAPLPGCVSSGKAQHKDL